MAMRACAICLILLLCAACNGGVATLPVATDLPAEVPNVIIATQTATPPVVDSSQTLTPVSQVRCATAPPVRLIIQERGRVTRNNERLNLRAGPGVDYEAVALLEEGAIFFVLDGPACSGEFTWFRVRIRGREGWLAEGDQQQYYVEPYLAG